jgi:pimeloyl-ACP methyl ester carboxylesterase
MDYVRHYSAAALGGIVFVSSHAGLSQGLPRTPQQEAGRQAQVQMLLQSPLDLRAGIAYGHDFVRQMTTKPLSAELYEIMLISHMQLPAYARRAMASRGLENADLIDKLTLPVRFLIGQTDSSPYISEPLIRGLSNQVPSGSLTIMPDAGHAVFVDAPEAFNAELGRFMTSLPGR